MPRKPMPWFRFYVEAVHDRKLRRLKPETRWLFVACLAAARQSPEPGWLLVGEDDPMDWDDLADFAGMTLKQVEHGTDALTTLDALHRPDPWADQCLTCGAEGGRWPCATSEVADDLRDAAGEGGRNGRIAEALGVDIVEAVEDAVARGAIPHDPRESATPDAGGPS